MTKRITIGAVLAAVLTIVVMALLYFSQCDLEGDALMNVCACGYCRVHMSEGVITLAEPNHDRNVGDIVGRYDTAGTSATVFSGTNQFTVATTQDHLGLRCVEPSDYRQYLVFKHKWKAFIYMGWTRITR